MATVVDSRQHVSRRAERGPDFQLIAAVNAGGSKSVGGVVHIFGSSGCGAASPLIEEVGPAPVFEAAFDGEQGVGSGLRPVAPRPLEAAADDLLAGAFHDAGADRQSELPAEVVAHSVRVGLVVADAGGDGFGPVAAPLQSGDDLGDPPGVQLRLDPVHPQLLFAFVRRQRLRGGGRACQGVEQVEDEDHFPSGENLFAGGSDPRRSVGQHRHPLGLEQAVPEPELPQAGAELRAPADDARRSRNAGRANRARRPSQ